MHDRAITMITERLAKEGIIVFHSGGKWFMADPQFGEMELPPEHSDDLNRQAREVEARLAAVRASAGRLALNQYGGFMAGPSTARPGAFVSNASQAPQSQLDFQREQALQNPLNAQRARAAAEDAAAVAAMERAAHGQPQGSDRPRVISDEGRRALEEAGVLPPSGGAGGGDRYNTSQVASRLGWSQAQVRAEAERRGLHREGRTWSFGEEDVTRLQGGGEAAGAGGAAGRGGWFSRMWGKATGAPPEWAAGGHQQLAGTVLGGLTGLAAGAWNVGAETVRSVASFAEGVMAAALGAAGGASGAGVARIAGGIGNMFSQAFNAGGQALGGVASALGEVLMGGLRLAGTIAIVGIAGALGALLIGGIVAVGSALGEAFGRMIGAASQAASDALSGVVTILKDLADTGKRFADTGIGLQGMGGVRPGQDAALQMFGQATGTNLTSMFSSWQMRPEFASARFGAVGAQFNPNDINGSIISLVQAIQHLPELLRVPMLNAVTGGQAAALMPLLYQTPGQLQRAANMPEQLGYSPQMTTEIYQQLNNNMSTLSALFTGLKLDVLSTALPSIERATNGLWGLWQAHRQEIMGLVGQIPGKLDELWKSGEKGWQELKGWWAGDGKTLWSEIKDIAFNTYQWFTGVFWPELSGFLSRAFHVDLGGAARPGHTHTPEEIRRNEQQGERAGTAVRNAMGGVGHWAGALGRGWTGQNREPGDPWAPYEAARHPWGAAAIGVGAALWGKDALGWGARTAWGGARGAWGRWTAGRAATGAAAEGAEGAEAAAGAGEAATGAAAAGGIGLGATIAAALGVALGTYYAADKVAQWTNWAGRGDEVRANRERDRIERESGSKIGEADPRFAGMYAHSRALAEATGGGSPNPASWIQGGTIHSTARQGADLSTMLERISQAIEHGFQRGQHQPPKTVQLMVSPESRYKAEIAEQSALNELHFVMVRAAG